LICSIYSVHIFCIIKNNSRPLLYVGRAGGNQPSAKKNHSDKAGQDFMNHFKR